MNVRGMSSTDHGRVTASSRSDLINKHVHVRVEMLLFGALLLHLSPLEAALPLIQLIDAVSAQTVVAWLSVGYVRVSTSQLLMSASATAASN